MSVSSVSSAPSVAVAPARPQSAPAAGATTAPAPVQRAADGDYKVASAQTSQVKDKDGDYKPANAASSAAARSSGAVQTSLSNLKVGG